MFKFKVTCELFDDYKNLIQTESFGVDLPGGKDHEQILTALAEAQGPMAGLAEQCAKIVIYKEGLDRQRRVNEDSEKRAMEQARERGLLIDGGGGEEGEEGEPDGE